MLLAVGTKLQAQDQKVADSLTIIYKKGGNTTAVQLELLRNLAFNELNDLTLAIRYTNELIVLSRKSKNDLYLFRGYYLRGNKLKLKGNLQEALSDFLLAIKIAQNSKNLVGEGVTYMAMANVFSVMKDTKKAYSYYEKAIAILRKSNEPLKLASALSNLGDEYLKNNQLVQALEYFSESGTYFEKSGYTSGIAYTLGNMGVIYFKQGKNKEAENNLKQAIQSLESIEDFYGISEYLIHLSDIYSKQNNWSKALSAAKRSYLLAVKNGYKDQISTSSLQLSKIYESTHKSNLSLSYFKKYVAYKDSVSNVKMVQDLADLRTNFEVSKKQAEVNILEKESEIQKLLAKKQQNVIYATVVAIILISLLVVGLFRRYQFIKKTNAIIESEKNRSNALLLNILPEETAAELKQSGSVRAKKFDSVSVLFTDFVGFTAYAENLSPEKLVESVDYYFSKFDAIIEKYDLEKIKTIGDAYMCAGGLPFETNDHAYKMILAAQEIIHCVALAKTERDVSHVRFDIRIGISTGPVVAGVVGTKKFAYDIWGDTVNTASRMESNSETGKINISEATFELVKDRFACEYRGNIVVKNRGRMNMYFIKQTI
ncbi:adenylate/guanylate cyclase domain-containing protein [Flavobacterium sp. LM5]|uniref:adenylate/guanylate cyclase domain-containing protein n=1 Tax=Flavobacterium sp. LM5 TaxID=1938610 RepID=UPI0009D2447C|nr:adenylate/guanylate cyclase domain-containing protein [Flavobacterium sp. LM5]OOV26324.1 adenylate/guanylate cyclase domain-containing protein [Flavobacterium sp. LM5]